MRVCSFYWTFLILIWLCIFAKQSKAVQFNVLIKLRELSQNKPVDAEVSLNKEKISTTLSRQRNGTYSFRGFLDIEEVETYAVSIEPKNQLYFPRSILLKNDKYKNEIKREFLFHLAHKQDFLNKDLDQYLNKGLQYFDGNNFDAALVHYEFLYKKEILNNMNNDQKIKFFFNYGRALYNTCILKKYEYDTCNKAIDIYQNLTQLRGKNQKSFEILKITGNELTRNINELRKKQFISKYQNIENLFNKGKFIDSAILAVSALEDRAKFPELFDEIGLTQDKLFTDAGVSFLESYQQALRNNTPTDQLKELLHSAREYLSKVKIKNEKIIQNIKFINNQLSFI